MDDEPYNILGLQLMINQVRIKGLPKLVDRAYNGLEAFNRVKDGFEKGTHVYGLVLTDISMPIMDGFEEAEKIRNFYRECQVTQPMIVAITGHIEEAYIQKAWFHEIDEVVPKPVNVDVLTSIFQNVIEWKSNFKIYNDVIHKIQI